MNPLVSAIVPTHDRPQLLKRAIQSVESQAYEPIELLVIGSPETPEIAHVVHGADTTSCEFIDSMAESPAAARNIGIQQAEGKWLAFLDDDDEWDPTKIDRQLERLNKTGAGVCHVGVRKVGPNEKVRAISRPTAEGDVTQELLTSGPYGTVSAMMVRSDIAQKVNGFDDEFTIFEDSDFNIRLSRHTKFCTISDDLVTKHADEQGHVSGDVDLLCSDGKRLLGKHRELAREFGSATEERMEVRLRHGMGRSAANSGKYSKAKDHFLSALRRRPTHFQSLLWLLLVAGGSLTFHPARSVKRGLVRFRDRVYQ